MTSKGDILFFPRRIALTFKRTRGSALGRQFQGLHKFCQLNLNNAVVLSTNPEDSG